MRKGIFVILCFLLCVTPASLFSKTAAEISPPDRVKNLNDESVRDPDASPATPLDAWILQPLTGLGAGLAANAGIMLVGDLLSLLTVHWMVYLPMGISFEEGSYLSSHYSSLASASLLYPLLVSAGVQAYGETLGQKGSGLTALFSYAGGAVGTALYFLGYRKAGVYTMLGAPVVGSMAGYLLSRSDVETQPMTRSTSEYRLIRNSLHLLYNFAGALMADFVFLSTKLQVPVLIEDTGDIFQEASSLFQGVPLEWLLYLPGSIAAGITITEKIEGRPGSPMLTFAASLLGSAAGWGLSAILESDSTVSAHIFAITAASLTSFFLQRQR